jgi:hypothetical protein
MKRHSRPISARSSPAVARRGLVAAIRLGVLVGLGALVPLGGCSDDCVNCVAPPPVAPTQVYSVNGDGRVTVYWNDYPEYYTETLSGYDVWRRDYEPGDEYDPARLFYFLAHVRVGQNHDPLRGQYHYVDTDVLNARDYEYAVSSVARHGESYLSFEFVVATPLPMSETPLTIFDVDGPQSHLSGFDFSLAAEHGGYHGNGAEGIVDPTAPGTSADILIRFDAQGVPWLETLRDDVRVQDGGTFLDANGELDFAGVYWAPEFGWSTSGLLEVITGHIYIIEIANEPSAGDLHYAKLGIAGINAAQRSVRIMWAYQLVNGLPVLADPQERDLRDEDHQAIRL